MRTDGQAIKRKDMGMIQAMEWIKRTLSLERIAVAAAKLVVAGYAGIALAQVLHCY